VTTEPSLWLGTLIHAVCVLPLLAPTLYVLGRLFSLRQDEQAPVWRIIWVVPVLFFVMSMMAGNIFMGRETVASATFLIVRLLSAIGMTATCVLLAWILRQEAERARMLEHARMLDNQMTLQRAQFAKLAENAARERAARHDIRHHLAVLQGYGTRGDVSAVNAYLQTLIGSLPRMQEAWCDNHVVNAVTSHYLSIAERRGIRLDVALDIPAAVAKVPDVDLCVLVGNLLENALEACLRMETGERFIRVRSDRQGDYLSMMVENSFDGEVQEKDGGYTSRKNPGRKGVGLYSAQTVCEKYDGLLRVESEGAVWRASALLTVGESNAANGGGTSPADLTGNYGGRE
jgi:sensor histidine kinase YesM